MKEHLLHQVSLVEYPSPWIYKSNVMLVIGRVRTWWQQETTS